MGIQAECNHKRCSSCNKEAGTRDASLQRSCQSAPWYLATTGAYLPCGESCHSAYSHLRQTYREQLLTTISLYRRIVTNPLSMSALAILHQLRMVPEGMGPRNQSS